jgi:hypothetical protein
MSWLPSDEKDAARTRKLQYQEELKQQIRQNEEASVDEQAHAPATVPRAASAPAARFPRSGPPARGRYDSDRDTTETNGDSEGRADSQEVERRGSRGCLVNEQVH